MLITTSERNDFIYNQMAAARLITIYPLSCNQRFSLFSAKSFSLKWYASMQSNMLTKNSMNYLFNLELIGSRIILKFK